VGFHSRLYPDDGFLGSDIDQLWASREDRFEIAAISIDWLVLVLNGLLLSFLFRRRKEVG
jgi:hypothetical protein